MIKILKIGAIATLLLFVVGCSSIKGPDGVLRDSNADIEKAYSVAPLKTPAGIKPIPSDPYYVVPNAQNVENAKSVSLLPPGSLAAQKNQ